jgi:pyridoxine 5'-phosphate synthase PdxJ
VNAGHDLNRDNLADFLRAVPGVLEVSIGHALVADALELACPRPCATTSAASARLRAPRQRAAPQCAACRAPAERA